MAFNSLPFLGFLAIVYGLFRVAPGSSRVWLLLIASLGFFAWASPASAGLLVACSLLSYYGALQLDRLSEHPERQQRLLIALVAIQVAILVVCKYSPLRTLASALGRFATTGHWNLMEVALPLGCSFFLFQGIGYLVDTAWGRPAECSLPSFLLFMGFFPKVLMGPIERGGSMLPQIEELSKANFCYDELRIAVLQFAWGLFKKVVIADRLALYVTEVYDRPGAYGGVVVLAAMFFYPLQLLADFSGYSDMAIGCARLFHIRITQNFEAPYGAPNIQEFWRRWHVSFSSWVAAFVFTPLRMEWRRLKNAGMVLSVYVTFILVGVWHGFDVNYLIFWLLHASYIAFSSLTLKARDSFWERRGLLHKPWFHALRVLATFTLVTVSFVFFRSASPQAAIHLLAQIPHWQGLQIGIHDGLAGPELFIAFLALIVWWSGESMFHHSERLQALLLKPLTVRWGVYFGLLFLILCFGLFRKPSDFIYFRF